MTKKLMMALGFGATLAVTAALAADQAKPAGSPAPATEKEARKAEISVDGKAHADKGKAAHGGACCRKSGSAKAEKSGDQNKASSGQECSKSAAHSKADCDKADCDKHSKAKAEAGAHEGADCHKPSGAETEI